jgi:ubiquinone/menaquinone biosynthesis C-methylase UbiE
MSKKYLSKDIEKIYDKYSNWYDFEMFFIELYLKRLRKRLINKARGKVLEVSVGSGVNLPFYNKNCKVVGIDLSEEMLKKARVKSQNLEVNVKFKRADVENLMFKDEEFDFVIDTLGLCTFSNPIKALKEMKRVCNKKGKVLLLLKRFKGDLRIFLFYNRFAR